MPQLPHNTDTLREQAVRRLLHLREHNELTNTLIHATAQAFGVHPRTIHRWITNAQAHNGTYTPAPARRFTLTPHMHDVLAQWCGNVTAAHRDLREQRDKDDAPLPALATFHRAVTRELTAGQLAGLRGGEAARRRFDVHGTRERGHRNDAWEADHVEASVWVNVDGHVRKPWITWFIDAAHDAIAGLAVTPQTAHRGSILVALRDSLLRHPPHSPIGGIPRKVRVDGGKDFLSNALRDALGALAIELVELPPRRPDLKGSIEALNGAVKKMLFRGMPGYTEKPTADIKPPARPPAEDLLSLEAFIAHLLNWVHRWNTEYTKDALGGLTPAQAWEADPTPIYDVDPAALHTYTLERHGTPLTITSNGVRWSKRNYVDDWMHGRGGDKVHLRYVPHQYDRVELYDAKDDRYLGPGFATEDLAPEKRRALQQARAREASELKAQLKRADKARKARFAPQTTPGPPREQHPLPTQDVEQQLRELHASDLAKATRPDYFPLPDPSPAWQSNVEQDPDAPTTEGEP